MAGVVRGMMQGVVEEEVAQAKPSWESAPRRPQVHQEEPVLALRAQPRPRMPLGVKVLEERRRPRSEAMPFSVGRVVEHPMGRRQVRRGATRISARQEVEEVAM